MGKAKYISKLLLAVVGVIAAVFVLTINTAAQELPDFGLNENNYSLPDTLFSDLEKNGITPQETDSSSLSAEKIFNYIVSLISSSITEPLALFVTLVGIILLCSLANVLTAGIGGSAKSVYSVVSALVGAAVITGAAAKAMSIGSETMESGSVFLSGFIPAFAGVVSMSGHVTSAAVLNSVIMGGAQLYMQLAVNLFMPVCVCIVGITLAGCVCPDLKLEALAQAAQKLLIWALGLMMTVFVALLGIQSFISVPADSVGIKAARFTVSNGVPFVGGAISDAMQVMQGGVNLIRSNFGTFGIIAGAALILPSLISVVCYKLMLSVTAAVSELFGTSVLTSLIKSAEGVMSVVLAMLACFLMMIIISLSLMIFAVGGAL